MAKDECKSTGNYLLPAFAGSQQPGSLGLAWKPSPRVIPLALLWDGGQEDTQINWVVTAKPNCPPARQD